MLNICFCFLIVNTALPIFVYSENKKIPARIKNAVKVEPAALDFLTVYVPL